MKAEEYFNLEAFDTPHGSGRRLRLKGYRIDIDDVLRYVDQGYSPERITTDVFPTLNVNQVQACIDYYRDHKEEVDQYVAQSARIEDAYYQEYLKQPVPPVVERLRALQASRESQAQANT